MSFAGHALDTCHTYLIPLICSLNEALTIAHKPDFAVTKMSTTASTEKGAKQDVGGTGGANKDDRSDKKEQE